MDYERLLAGFVAALAINELAHIVLETWGIRARLRNWGKPIMWHGLLFGVVTGVFFGLLIMLDLSIATLLYLAIFIMVVIFAYTTIAIDAYHEQIGKALKKSSKD